MSRTAAVASFAVAVAMLAFSLWGFAAPSEATRALPISDSEAGCPQPQDASSEALLQPDDIPQATPVLAVDDTRTQWPTTRDWWDIAVDSQFIAGPHGESVWAFREQGSIGLPTFSDRQLHDILGGYAPYQLRARTETLHSSNGWLQGPLTLGFQQYLPIDPVAISPLLYAHLGLETVLSSPWLSGRYALPPTAVRIVDGVDTELVQNGWSLRPLSVYARGDFLACRTIYAEVGGAPELFVPTVGPTEYDVRFHAAVGWSFGCTNRATSSLPKIALEYRGRARLHADDAPVAYWDSLGIGLQYDLGWFVIQALASTDPGKHTSDYWMLGLRLQVGQSKESY